LNEDPLAHAGTQVVYVHPDLLGSAALLTDWPYPISVDTWFS